MASLIRLAVLSMVIVFFCANTESQAKTLDSLLVLSKQDFSTDQKITLYTEISEEYLKVNPVKALEYAKQVINWCNDLTDYQKQWAKAQYLAGKAYMFNSQLKLSQFHFNKALSFYAQSNDLKAYGNCLKDLGTIAYYQNQQEEATRLYQEALLVFEQCGYTLGAGHCHLNLGNVWKMYAEYAEAMDEYLLAVKIYEKEKAALYSGMAYNNLGNIYFDIEDYKQAESYYLKAREFYQQTDNIRQNISLGINLGLIAQETGHIENSLQWYEETLKLAQESSFPKQIPLLHNNQASLFLEQKELKKAEIQIKKAYEAAEKNGDELERHRALLNHSELAIQLGQYKQAAKSAESAYEWATQNKQYEITQIAAQNLETVYEKTNQHKKALHYLKIAHSIQDSMNNRGGWQKVAAHTFQDQLEQQKQKQELQQLQTKLNYEAEISKQRFFTYFALAGLFISLLLIYIVYRSYRAKAKAKQELDAINFELDAKNKELNKYIESNLQLENFAYIASHDLRTPVRSIVSFAQLLERSLKDRINKNEKEYIDFIVSYSKNMHLLINDLLQYSQVGTQKTKVEVVQPKLLLTNLIQQIEQSHKHQIEIQLDAESLPQKMHVDPVMIKQLFQNLIENGLKYTSPNVVPKVTVSAREVDGSHQFLITDNGIGIATEYQEKIFLLFKRLHHQSDYKGTGIGLSICKKIVEQHNGQIGVDSQPGEGSTFYFTIPKVEAPELVLT